MVVDAKMVHSRQHVDTLDLLSNRRFIGFPHNDLKSNLLKVNRELKIENGCK